MKDALEKQRADLEEKKKKIESGRPITPEKNSVNRQAEGLPSHLNVGPSNCLNMWLLCCMYRAFLLLTFPVVHPSLGRTSACTHSSVLTPYLDSLRIPTFFYGSTVVFCT
ncbi:hypothetical protein K438DRAFT_1078228 [Mycena galopus ATCC 62051]|nr:hypothetical protein K438DRAFT_1078228 [Mycena galopus ATCC 62051]